MSKSEFDSLMEKSANISQGYQFTGLKDLSPQSDDVLSALAQFSRPLSSEERDAAEPVLAASARGGGGEAAPALAHIRDEVPAQIQIEREFLRDLIQLRFQELARDRADIEWDAQWNAPVPAPPIRANDSNPDFIHYIRRGS